LTENKIPQFFFSQAGDTEKVEFVNAIALFDAADGIVRYMYHVITMSYAPKSDPETVEKEAISRAKKFGLNTDDLQVIHIVDADPGSEYKFDVTTKKLEKIPPSEIYKVRGVQTIKRMHELKMEIKVKQNEFDEDKTRLLKSLYLSLHTQKLSNFSEILKAVEEITR
jgi:hypothetical protein